MTKKYREYQKQDKRGKRKGKMTKRKRNSGPRIGTPHR